MEVIASLANRLVASIQHVDVDDTDELENFCVRLESLYVIVPRKRAHNVGTLESLFIVESDKAFFQLQNDTKIDHLAVFYPEICSREW